MLVAPTSLHDAGVFELLSTIAQLTARSGVQVCEPEPPHPTPADASSTTAGNHPRIVFMAPPSEGRAWKLSGNASEVDAEIRPGSRRLTAAVHELLQDGRLRQDGGARLHLQRDVVVAVRRQESDERSVGRVRRAGGRKIRQAGQTAAIDLGVQGIRISGLGAGERPAAGSAEDPPRDRQIGLADGGGRAAVNDTSRPRQRQPNHGGEQPEGLPRREDPTSGFHLTLLVLKETKRCQGRAQTSELFIPPQAVAHPATSCIDPTSVGWPRMTSRKIDAGRSTCILDSSTPSVPTGTTEIAYCSPPGSWGMSKPVAPVWRAQGKSHWACPAQGVALGIGFDWASTPCNTSRTVAMAGSAHSQSVM